MNGDIDSAFVEIAASAPESSGAVERLLPLYQDIAEDAPQEPLRPRRQLVRGCVWALLITVLMTFTFVGLAATSSSPRPTYPIPSPGGAP